MEELAGKDKKFVLSQTKVQQGGGVADASGLFDDGGVDGNVGLVEVGFVVGANKDIRKTISVEVSDAEVLKTVDVDAVELAMGVDVVDVQFAVAQQVDDLGRWSPLRSAKMYCRVRRGSQVRSPELPSTRPFWVMTSGMGSPMSWRHSMMPP